MYIVEPFDVISGLLTTSNIPEPDASAGEIVWSAYTAAVGDLRIVLSTHKIYKCAAETTDDPVTGAAKAIPTWVEVGYTNRYRMFDQVNSSQSSRTSPIIVEITSPRGFNSAAIFNASGVTSVRFECISSTGATVYDNSVDAISNDGINDWWPYFNEPVVQRFKFAVNDIPKAAGSKLRVTISGAGTVSVGTLVIGASVNLGIACSGTSFEYINTSKLIENAYGDITIQKGRKYKLMNYDVRTDKSKLDFVIGKLSGLIDQPMVWGDTVDSDDVTCVYGFYSRLQQNIDQPTKCTATIQVRELV